MVLSRRDQALVALLVIILIGFGFYRRLYLPLNKEIRAITASNQQLQAEKEKLRAQAGTVPAQPEPLEDKLASLNKRLPADDEMISLLTALDETMAEHNLPFAAIDYKREEKPDKTGVRTLTFNIGTEGRVTQLLNLLDEMEKTERLISVEEISFAAVKAGIREAGGEKESSAEAERPMAENSMSDSFEMKITINAYYAGRGKAVRAEADDRR